jgi:hypothetical protein
MRNVNSNVNRRLGGSPLSGGVARSDSGRVAPGWVLPASTHPEAFSFCPSQEGIGSSELSSPTDSVGEKVLIGVRYSDTGPN